MILRKETSTLVQTTKNLLNKLVCSIGLTHLGFCRLYFEALNDFMLKILLVSAVVSIVASMIVEVDHRSTGKTLKLTLLAWIEGTAILLAVQVVATVTAWNDYKKEQQFLALNKLSDSKNTFALIRNG